MMYRWAGTEKNPAPTTVKCFWIVTSVRQIDLTLQFAVNVERHVLKIFCY